MLVYIRILTPELGRNPNFYLMMADEKSGEVNKTHPELIQFIKMRYLVSVMGQENSGFP